MCIVTVSLIGDILSLVAIKYRYVLPLFLVEFLCKTYIITLVWGAWSSLIYVLSDFLTKKKHKKITFRLLLVAAVQNLIIYSLPIYIFSEGNQTYTYGPATLGVYIFVGIYIIATLTTTYVFRKNINPRRIFAIILWMLIWILSAAIQFLHNELLLVGFASALGVLILFVIMENPEANLEHKLGCFNSYALTEYLKQLYKDKNNFGILEISVENTRFIEEHGIDANAVIREMLQICGKDVLAFKNINLGLVLVSETTGALEYVGQTIIERFSNYWMFQEFAILTLTSQAGTFSNSEELFRFLAFVQTECKDERGKLIFANEEMVSKYKEQYLIEQEITEALLEDRVEVFLQPIYSTQENHFTSAEALVRIRKRNGELIPPWVFIPVAENNGQILELGERVFEKVCHFLKNTEAVTLGVHYIEINLSVVQCEKMDLSERLISIIEKYQINPRLINLEITETASIHAQKILLENMKKLITYGFSFSLDDFGKGESNLMYVVDMPISIIKLDYDMSKAFFHIPKAKQVVSAVVGMAHGMGLKVVAEGIETQEEMEQITKEKVDYIQGYYYSKPLPMSEFLEFLHNHFHHYKS